MVEQFNKEIKEQVEAMSKGYTEISIEALEDLIVTCEVAKISGEAKEEIISPNGIIPKGAYVTVEFEDIYHDVSTALINYKCEDGSGEYISVEKVPLELIKVNGVF